MIAAFVAVVVSGMVAGIFVAFDAQNRRHADALYSSVMHLKEKDGE